MKQYNLKLKQSDIALILIHLEATGDKIDSKLMKKIKNQANKQGYDEETEEILKRTESMKFDSEIEKYRQK